MSHVDEGRLQAFLDGELAAEQEIRIEDHLADCKECAATFDEVVEVHARSSRLLSELEESPAMPDYQQLVARAAEAEAERNASGPSFLLPGLAWAATLALAFFLGWQASDRSSIVGGGSLEVPMPAPAPVAESIEGDEPDAARLEEEPAVEREALADAAAEVEAGGEAPPPERQEEVAESSEAPPDAMRSRAFRAPVEEESAGLPARAPDELRMQAAPASPPAGEWEAEPVADPMEAGPFTRIAPSEVVSRFGAQPLRAGGSDLREMAIGPPGIFPDGLEDGPVLRSTYDLPGRTGRWIVWQQRTLTDGERESPSPVELRRRLEASPAGVSDDGLGMIEWKDPRGFTVRVAARLPAEQLRDLAMQLELR